MSTVESILLNNEVYSLELELELLRFFENKRLSYNARRFEHAIKQSQHAWEWEPKPSLMMPTIESILVNHEVYSTSLKLELLRFFESKLSVYNRLGFDQAIYKSIIVRLEYKMIESYSKDCVDKPYSKMSFVQPFQKRAL